MPPILPADKIIRVVEYESDEEYEYQRQEIGDFIKSSFSSCEGNPKCILIIDTFDHVSATLLELYQTTDKDDIITRGILFDSTCEHCKNEHGKIVPNGKVIKILGEDICNNLICINVERNVDDGIESYGKNTLQVKGTCTELMTTFVCINSLLANDIKALYTEEKSQIKILLLSL